jgi:hypothetical protein
VPRTAQRANAGWLLVLDTAVGWVEEGPVVEGGGQVLVQERSLVVMKRWANGTSEDEEPVGGG